MKPCFFVLVFFLTSCGSSGGGDVNDTSQPPPPPPPPPILITSSDLIQYVPGDYLAYSYKFNSVFYDGSVAADTQGTLNIDILPSSYSTPIITIPVKLVFSIEEFGAVTSSSIGYYGYDATGSFRQYLLKDLIFVNQIDNDLGSLLIASPLGSGTSWSNTALDYVEGVLMEVVTDYSVIKTEIINTAYGDIEAFKIIYSSTGEEVDCILCIDTTSFSGVIWVHPSIGIIKLSEEGVLNIGLDVNYSLSWSLSGFSISSYNE